MKLYKIIRLILLMMLIGLVPLASSANAKSKPKGKSAPVYYAMPLLSLDTVECPTDPKQPRGPKIHRILPGNYAKYYSDGNIAIMWDHHPAYLIFSLENKTDHSIKILWDESSFVDTNNSSHRIIHTGVKYIDKGNPQAPSVVPRKGSYQDVVISADNIEWLKYSSQWIEHPILPGWQRGGTMDEFQRKLNPLVGKTMQVLLSLDIDGVPVDYVFIFQIDEFKTWREGEKPFEHGKSDRPKP